MRVRVRRHEREHAGSLLAAAAASLALTLAALFELRQRRKCFAPARFFNLCLGKGRLLDRFGLCGHFRAHFGQPHAEDLCRYTLLLDVLEVKIDLLRVSGCSRRHRGCRRGRGRSTALFLVVHVHVQFNLFWVRGHRSGSRAPACAHLRCCSPSLGLRLSPGAGLHIGDGRVLVIAQAFDAKLEDVPFARTLELLPRLELTHELLAGRACICCDTLTLGLAAQGAASTLALLVGLEFGLCSLHWVELIFHCLRSDIRGIEVHLGEHGLNAAPDS
mmetsp:Transcript_53503/g.153575  ORF Transcript_53503/g.153575 Transcript_53503/m.153575 type:complete len:274 (+) Transcript_53503:58-879(+)